MKMRRLVLLVSLCWVVSASGQGVRPQNTMSVFFDTEGYVPCRDLTFTGAPIPVNAYFLLVSPSASQVQSWEARIESDIVAVIRPGEWTITGGVNTALAPDFRVDLGPTPLPATPCGVVLLAQREMLFFMITGEHADFTVSGIPGSSEFDGCPGYWSEAGEPLEGVSLFGTWDVSQAWINADWCDDVFLWYGTDIDNVSVYTTDGEPASCILGSTVSLYGYVATGQDVLGGSTYYIVDSGKGIRVSDPTPRDFLPVARVVVTGTLAVDDGEIIVVDPTAVDVTGNQYPPLIPLDSTIATLAAAYDHVGGLVRLYGEVVSTDVAGFVLTDAGATLRVEIPASLGVDPTAYQPGQVLTVSGIFSIMNGKHLIVRDAAEIVEGNVANERRTMGGVKALFR